ncbi:hypothetical protein CF327_g5867 [Tilletia walkeri]|nr:hypothetical protein CF327_g5867 [Tilletia walkeri]
MPRTRSQTAAASERVRAVRRAAAARRRANAAQNQPLAQRAAEDGPSSSADHVGEASGVQPAPRPAQAPLPHPVAAAVQQSTLASSAAADDDGAWWNNVEALQRRLEETGSTFRAIWLPSCIYCTAVLLDYEDVSFCCHRGARVLAPLPDLPPVLAALQGQDGFGPASLALNQVFHFAVHAYSGSRIQFPSNGPPAFAIEGYVYQRMLPLERASNPLHMYLYNTAGLDSQVVPGIPQYWMPAVRQEIEQHNPLLQRFREFAEVAPLQNATLELSVQGPAREIAAILQYGAGTRTTPRSVYVNTFETDGAVRLNTSFELYEPLSYPLLFPHGTPGWPVDGWKQQQYFKYRLMTEARFQSMWRLANLYVVDMLTRIEERRLDFVASSMVTAHRRRIPPSHELSEDGTAGNNGEDPGSVHASLPSSFIGSKAYRAEQVGDALELARRFGRPHGMLTLTTNPQWPELIEVLRQGQTATDAPHLTIRVFRARLSRVMAMFKKEYGKPTYVIRVIEFQKRGLPHAHIVFALHPECPVSCIDKIASGEVPPNSEPRLRELVLRFMVHSNEHLIRANGEPNSTSRCFRDGKCIYGFP